MIAKALWYMHFSRVIRDFLFKNSHIHMQVDQISTVQRQWYGEFSGIEAVIWYMKKTEAVIWYHTVKKKVPPR
jgi:hypothetical protein